jgi:Skp family chaperone for outer membrane proteins
MRTPLVVSVAIAGCFGLLAVTQLAAQRPQSPSASRNATVLVDMSAIMKDSARFNQAMERLKNEYQTKAEKMKQESERGNQLTAELRTLPPSDPRRKQLEEQIMKMRADYELEGKKVTNDIRDAESKIVLGLLGELKGELERYAQANQVKLILRNDPTPPDLTDPRMILQEIHKPIVYQEGSDVTPAILDTLNRGAAPAASVPTTGRAPARPVR